MEAFLRANPSYTPTGWPGREVPPVWAQRAAEGGVPRVLRSLLEGDGIFGPHWVRAPLPIRDVVYHARLLVRCVTSVLAFAQKAFVQTGSRRPQKIPPCGQGMGERGNEYRGRGGVFYA